MHLPSLATLFLKSATSQLENLVKQALVDDGAWQVLTDQLLEDGEIIMPSVADPKHGPAMLNREVRIWIVDNFFSPLKNKRASEVGIGDLAEFDAPMGGKYGFVVGVESDESTSMIRIELMDKRKSHIDVYPQTPSRVQEPPPDWDKQAIVKRLGAL